MSRNDVRIIGMGALGLLYGELLTQGACPAQVSYLLDGARRERYQSRTVTVNGAVRHFCCVQSERADTFADFLFFAVKATGLGRAMADARAHVGPDTVIVSLLNGITSEEILEAQFPSENVVYCVAQGMDAVCADGALTFTRPGTIAIGIPKDRPDKAPALDALCELLERTQVPYFVDSNIRRRLLSKFMLNVGVNQVVMVREGTYGTVQRPGPAREEMIAAMREVIALSQHLETPLQEQDLQEYVQLIDTLSPDGMPSMRQDGLARRPSEVELFSGTVLKLAGRYSVDVPVNRRLYRTICDMERGYPDR